MSFEHEIYMSRQLSLGELLSRNARKFPHKEALVVGEKRLSYRRLDERVNKLANAMKTLGIKKGDKVATYLKNGLEIIEVYFAAAKIGAVAVPINFRLAPGEIAFILNDSESRLLFLDREFWSNIEIIKDQMGNVEKYILVAGPPADEYVDYEDFLGAGEQANPKLPVDEDDDAFILYTAGTTGRPKGALLSHKNIFIDAMTMALEHHHSFEDRHLCVPPLFHSAALCAMVIHMIVIGTTIVMRDFDPLELLKMIEKERITFVFLVPSMWIFLLNLPELEKYDTSSLRIASTGGAVMPVSVKKAIMSKFPNSGVIDTFGQTEMAPCATTLKARDALRKEGSVGLPLAIVEVRIVDELMNDVPVGEVGEIVYRGPNMFKGYYKKPVETQEAFYGGWFHSGDMVQQDEEGFIYVKDRKKDMLISGGENIYPAEIEEVLYSHPKIIEAAVIGVPDPQWGESVKAFIVLKEGQQMTSEEVVAHCTNHLARYKRPSHVEFLNALPRNAAGKVLKRELRSRRKDSTGAIYTASHS